MHLAVSSPNLADSPAQLSSDTGEVQREVKMKIKEIKPEEQCILQESTRFPLVQQATPLKGQQTPRVWQGSNLPLSTCNQKGVFLRC